MRQGAGSAQAGGGAERGVAVARRKPFGSGPLRSCHGSAPPAHRRCLAGLPRFPVAGRGDAAHTHTRRPADRPSLALPGSAAPQPILEQEELAARPQEWDGDRLHDGGTSAWLSRKRAQLPRSRQVEEGPRAAECQVRPCLGEGAEAFAKENVPLPTRDPQLKPSRVPSGASVCPFPSPVLWCPEIGLMSPAVLYAAGLQLGPHWAVERGAVCTDILNFLVVRASVSKSHGNM